MFDARCNHEVYPVYGLHYERVRCLDQGLFLRRSEHSTKTARVGFVVDTVLKQPISFTYILDSPGSYNVNNASFSFIISAGQIGLPQVAV